MTTDIKEAIAELRDAVRAMQDVDLGQPAGVNEVRHGASAEELRWLESKLAPDDFGLVELYREAGAIWLPDVHVGYFVHPINLIRASLGRGEPHAISGVDGGAVLPFGTDGGGGRFVMRLDRCPGRIDYLGAGRVVGGVFDGDDYPARVLSADIKAFVDWLSRDVRAFISGDAGWQYIV